LPIDGCRLLIVDLRQARPPALFPSKIQNQQSSINNLFIPQQKAHAPLEHPSSDHPPLPPVKNSFIEQEETEICGRGGSFAPTFRIQSKNSRALRID